ncbi:hypothetical protein J7E73_32305 [Paenibacillus albidus]|uniref:hypothetical protein n=1 Tax=Paenibacillus albidus TaxID=2041023 RepID=UPI001BECE4D1|nr:hypothetical protein [Paenibacillus albidus]MBT2293695.1 hypothetical protein [Paenibacillus albidus]
MSITNNAQHSDVIYQADPAAVQHLHGVRESLHQCCKPYMNHHVCVQTLDGQMHEGVLAGMDGRHVYLNVTAPEMSRGFFNPYPGIYPSPYYPGVPYGGNAILPLVLFELLAISLI